MREETGEELERARLVDHGPPAPDDLAARGGGDRVQAYPRAPSLGLALFVGQAFIYNAVTFGLGTLPGRVLRHRRRQRSRSTWRCSRSPTSSARVLLGRLFDTVGRKPMIAGTYIGSALVLVVLTVLFVGGSLGTWGFMALLLATFFLASAGASSAYLTVSEIFPMETRALAIAFFYAIGTAIGGITGPLLFGEDDRDAARSARSRSRFFLGAGVMALGGIVELSGRRQGRAGRAGGHRQAAHRRGGGGRAADEEVAASPTPRPQPRPRRGGRRARAGAPLPARPGPHAPTRPAWPSPRRSPSWSSPARSSASSARWPSTARPSGASWPAWSERASGARAGSRRRSARRC